MLGMLLVICLAVTAYGVTRLKRDFVDFEVMQQAGVRVLTAAPLYREEDGQRVMKQSEITIRVILNRGASNATLWTCDLSHDYVSINADYRS